MGARGNEGLEKLRFGVLIARGEEDMGNLRLDLAGARWILRALGEEDMVWATYRAWRRRHAESSELVGKSARQIRLGQSWGSPYSSCLT